MMPTTWLPSFMVLRDGRDMHQRVDDGGWWRLRFSFVIQLYSNFIYAMKKNRMQYILSLGKKYTFWQGTRSSSDEIYFFIKYYYYFLLSITTSKVGKILNLILDTKGINIYLDYKWNSQLAIPHLALMHISPVSCQAIPLVGTGQRKNKEW